MKIKSFVIFFIICIILSSFFVFFTTPLEFFFLDAMFIMSTISFQSYDISDHIVIVLIDSKSEQRLSIPIEGKGWRKYDPEIIALLKQNGASVIAFDVEFSGESTPWDENLALQYRKAGNVIACEINEGNTLPSLKRELYSTGNASVKTLFGRPRKIELFPDYMGQRAFSYEVVSAYLVFLADKERSNRDMKKHNLDEAVKKKEYWINYKYPVHYFPVFSYIDLLNSRNNRIGNQEKTPLSVFKNRIVLIAKDFQKDKIPLPNNFGRPVFGGLVHAYGMQTLVDGSRIRKIPLIPGILILVCFLGCIHLLLIKTRGLKSILFVSLLFIAVFILQLILFQAAHYWFSCAALFTGSAASVLIYGIYKRYMLVKEFQLINTQMKRLTQFNTQLEETGKLKDLLTDTLVHDIKNAIAAIEGSLYFISEKYKEDTQSLEVFHAASIACTDIISLSSNLLDVRNIEEGKLELHKEPCPIGQLKGMISRFTHYPLFYEKRITVDINLPDEIPVLSVDTYLLEQVFHNLLNNALKYTPANGRITVSGETEKNRKIIITFYNSGKPVPEEMKESIFEKYKRGTKKRSKYSKGLGLYFCKMAMEMQGGGICVETDETGNYFKVMIPAE
ncbi:MAG: CHASE2 domain-containing protein [Spirochaetales bacterium]|nr:CHASE2 domain-containing protein [Spirochaetales bacterium]